MPTSIRWSLPSSWDIVEMPHSAIEFLTDGGCSAPGSRPTMSRGLFSTETPAPAAAPGLFPINWSLPRLLLLLLWLLPPPPICFSLFRRSEDRYCRGTLISSRRVVVGLWLLLVLVLRAPCPPAAAAAARPRLGLRARLATGRRAAAYWTDSALLLKRMLPTEPSSSSWGSGTKIGDKEKKRRNKILAKWVKLSLVASQEGVANKCWYWLWLRLSFVVVSGDLMLVLWLTTCVTCWPSLGEFTNIFKDN